ncbi:MAG: hypothetical protein HY904_04770 [Deltaproteobacteria bacterium]|nr:hypothetical protein [Deltaproteobacteria bacterium]
MLLAALLAGGCGLESLFFVRQFEATPPPHAIIKGRVSDVGDVMATRLADKTLTARAVATDGRVLSTAETHVDGDFTLNLPADVGDQFNVRVLVGVGGAQLRGLAPDVPGQDGTDNAVTEVGTLGLAATAAALLVDAYTATARSGMAGTPPSVTRKVLENASDRANEDVLAYHVAVRSIVEASDAARGQPVFSDTGEPTEAAITAAGLTVADYTRLRDAAVAAVGVPVVCDPSRIRVMFTVDISGSALDGNGKQQFIRQLPKEGRVFLGITVDPSSPVADASRTLKPRLMPNDVDTEMFDDGTQGDEAAGDQVFTTTLVLPRGMRVIYKYTDGSPGEGYTGTEEWPGNARILEVVDVLTSDPAGKPDCLVIRRDSFGDESSNKNFVNLNASLAGGALQYDTDLGGAALVPATGADTLPQGGLAVDALGDVPPLTPAGVPEARENGACATCPAPVTVPVDDNTPPAVVAARFAATDEVRVLFTEDLDLGSAAARGNYLVVDDREAPVPIRRIGVAGALVTLSVDPVVPTRAYRLFVARVSDASLQRNPVAEVGGGIRIQQDTIAPTLVEAACTTITEVNPAARPANPRQGEVVLVRFSEVLDRISAENTSGYAIEGPEGSLPVYAAFQRGRDVLLVTESLTGNVDYAVRVTGVFDMAGNLVGRDSTTTFKGLQLYRASISAVPGHAWRSVDGRDRGLPEGDGLYLTGTLTLAARATDGADIRVTGRPDVAGRAGFELLPTPEMISGKPVFRAELLLPPGTYAYKLAHGSVADAVAPPATLETVTKSLCTTNNATGVQVDPVTLTGTDGLSYAGARLSLSGDDPPGPGVLFKRENPDSILNVVDADVDGPVHLIGTWRDVPFGAGRDYDDGKRELTMPVSGATDTAGPLPIAAEARDSESVLVSFDEAISTNASDLVATVTDEGGVALPASVLVTAVPRPSQAVLRTGPMALNRGYTVLVSRVADGAGHVSTDLRTVAFTSPGSFTPFTPVVDEDPPAVTSVLATGPTTILVRFTERVASSAAAVSHYALEHRTGGTAPTVSGARLSEAGRAVILTTSAQERLAPYALVVTSIEDVASPPNRLTTQRVEFNGFGDSTPPEITWAKAVNATMVVLKFSEALDASTAATHGNYAIAGVNVLSATPSHNADVARSAFNEAWAPVRQDLVVLKTDTMQGGRTLQVSATGVLDLSGNASASTAAFTSVAQAPNVTVVLRYLASNTAQVVGVGQGGAAGVPARAISAARLAAEREGIFVLGTALTEDGATPVTDSPLTRGLGGFPAEGSPLDGVEPQLKDDGTGGDATAGDNIFTLQITGVPLGSVVSYKAFASYSVAYQQSSGDPLAAFADAPAGPRVFTDGQEYPGNDNAAWLLADEDGDGKIVLDNLFGDEITFKRKTGFRPFAWVTDAWRRQE